jgi:hypothetical protein
MTPVATSPAPPVAPAPAPPATPAPAPTSSPVTYVFDAGVSESDRSIIESAAQLAQQYFQRQFNRAVQRAVTVTVRDADGPFGASAGGNAILVYTGHEGWRVTARIGRTKTMVHEMFHILQEEVGWPPPYGGWSHEGSAEYVGYMATVDAGMVSYDDVQRCQIANYFFADGASSPRLEHLSFEPTSPVRGRYLIAWLAWDRLLNGPANVPRLARFWTSGFTAAFGTAEPAFYDDFAAYRTALRQPAGNPCAALR